MNLIKYINQMNKELQICDDNEYEENSVSELMTHKILYILYGCFYNRFNKELFKANFQAWKYGPVEIDYRYEFKKGNSNYDKFNTIDLNQEQKDFLDQLTKKLLKVSSWFLVDFTQNTSAWFKNYEDNKSNIISLNDIEQSFKGVII